MSPSFGGVQGCIGALGEYDTYAIRTFATPYFVTSATPLFVTSATPFFRTIATLTFATPQNLSKFFQISKF